ncbi:MAG: DNA polymerase III subunit delta' [Gammaproteobacteria bacterium]|nr:DNA polymerase III subunit delta' [Gammaproteobacteria bacterium]
MSNTTLQASPDIFTWQTQVWQHLWHAKQNQRLAHALLFLGQDGIGMQEFALAFANAILCSQPNELGNWCRACQACHLLHAGTHPDLIIIEPEKAGQKISVDQIRDIIKSVNETTLQGGYRIVVINPSTSMNTNAANALLKSLEEPVNNTLFILISDEGLRLPATIMSRCQKIVFAKPTHTQAVQWLQAQLKNEKIDTQLLLKLADGAPLRALSLLEKDLLGLRKDVYQGLHALSQGHSDPVKLAAKWQNEDQINMVDLLLSWLTDLLRYKLTEDPAHLINSDYHNEIVKISVSLLKNNLLAYIEHLQQTRGVLLTSANLNKQLLLEDLLIRWTHYVSS